MALPAASLETLIQGVYTGSISVFELPNFLYAYTVERLDKKFFSGYGTIPKGAIKELEKAVHYRDNLGRFSGAKTFHEVNDLSKHVFTKDGFKRPFSEFKKIALDIDETYNVNWLRTEQDSVFQQSQNARKWLKAESEADIFPVLEYIAVGDDRTRHDHKALDGLRAKVGDPIWDKIYPANGWNCRCTIKQHENIQVSSRKTVRTKTKPIKDEFKNNPDFNYNPGKETFIFKPKGKGKHNYFKVPREFSDELKDNFGFPSVDEVTGKKI